MRRWAIVVLLLLGCAGPPPTAPHESPPTPSVPADPKFHSVREDLYKVDLEALIDVDSAAQLETTRKAICQFVWGTPAPPDRLPEITEGVTDSPLKGLLTLQSLDRWVVKQQYGVDSIAYCLRPEKANGRALLYHAGHDTIAEHAAFLQRCLDEGLTVMALEMPLVGSNPKPRVHHEQLGPLWLYMHNQLWLLPGSAQRFFLTPPVVCINQLQKEGFKTISMAGFSGGGWTTTLVAALDPRILRSYPIAGSLPLFLRDWHPEAGDMEQWDPEFYQRFNYLELYVLGGAGPGRAQIQMLNRFDGFTFYGVRYQVYEKAVDQKIKDLGTGGSFSVYADEISRHHEMHERHLDRVLEDQSQL